MKKILVLGATILLVAALISGGTWAYFSDTETSSNNVFTAGTLALKLGATSSLSGTFTSDFLPGNEKGAIMHLTNVGSLDAKTLNLVFTFGTNAGQDNGIVDISARTGLTISGNGPDVGGGASTDNISKMIKVVSANWTDLSNGNLGANGVELTSLELKTLDDLQHPVGSPLVISLTSISPNTVPLPAGGGGYLSITFAFDPTAGNGCQGNALTMKMSATAQQ